jgi:L,D-peptidoglycan transpeptidase YkuD (ErfK/YbiS/YcfS/YnhG family)
MRPLLPALAGLTLIAACGAHPAAAPPTSSVPTPFTVHPSKPSPVRPTPRPTPVRTTSRPVVTPTHTTPRRPTPEPAHTTLAPPAPVRAAAPPAVPRATYPATLAAVPSSAAQAITVTATSYGATTATYEAWHRVGGLWRPVYGPWPAHVGYNGVARPGEKREGDGRIPSGVYGFSFMFGVEANPGVHYPWRAVTGTYDVWDDDPSSPLYNEWVDDRSAAAGVKPEPMDNTPVYDEGAVIAYNTARTPGLGSAIFMHVSDGGPTAGCVSLAQPDLTEVLRWMQPGTDISIGLG